MSFYRSGLRLSFKSGKLAETGTWSPFGEQRAGASFPDLTFLKLVFGGSSLEELESVFPDCSTATDDARLLLKSLFPRQITPVDGLW